MKNITCTFNFPALLRILDILARDIFFTVSDAYPNSIVVWIGNPDHLTFSPEGKWSRTDEFSSNPEGTICLAEPILVTDFPLNSEDFVPIFEATRMPNVTVWVARK